MELTCEILGLKDKNGKSALPEYIKYWTIEKRKNWLYDMIDPVVDALFVHFSAPIMEGVNMQIETGNEVVNIVAPAHLRGQHIDMFLHGKYNMSHTAILPVFCHVRLERLRSVCPSTQYDQSE